MKIKLKQKPEHIALIKAMGSNDESTSKEAMKIFANLVGPLAKRVLDETNVVDSLYDQLNVGEFEPRTIPLDDYHDIDSPDHVRVTYSSRPGSLANSQLTGADDVPFATFWITAAISFFRRYLRSGRLSHAEKGIQKMINEVRYKLKIQGIQPILDMLGNVQTNGKFHVIRSQTANQLVLHDFNRLQTLAARIVTSQFGGTPDGSVGRGVDTLLMSPEMVQEIRAIVYEPMNTRAGSIGANETSNTSLAAPESLRQAVYGAAGIPSIYGTTIIQLNEMGVGQEFNTIFDTLSGSNAFEGHAGSGTGAFNGASEELVLGIARNVGTNGFLKINIEDSESGNTFNARPDNQYVEREGKVGMYGTSEQGYIAVEARNVFGLIV